MTNEIFSYIRDNKNRRCGLLIVRKENDCLKFGYSLCCKKDKFNRDLAFHIARSRCNSTIDTVDEKVELFMSSKRIYINKILDRAKKYFKTVHTVSNIH